MSKAHPAQDKNLSTASAVGMLRLCANICVAAAEELRTGKPSKASKEELRRQLAGVVANVEIVRLALDR